MKLNPKQFKFTLHTAFLIIYAYTIGYKATWGDAYATTGHKENSNHYIRLAIDLNLFKSGRYIEDSEGHTRLGKFWKRLSKENKWGGDFSDKDYNHYSREHDGRM